MRCDPGLRLMAWEFGVPSLAARLSSFQPANGMAAPSLSWVHAARIERGVLPELLELLPRDLGVRLVDQDVRRLRLLPVAAEGNAYSRGRTGPPWEWWQNSPNPLDGHRCTPIALCLEGARGIPLFFQVSRYSPNQHLRPLTD